MPAAAVIPAPIAYIKVVAVKKLVVGFLEVCLARHGYVCECRASCHPSSEPFLPSLGGFGLRIFYFEKIRVFKAGFAEYISME